MEYRRIGIKRFNEKEVTLIVCVQMKTKLKNGYEYLFTNCIIVSNDFEYINHLHVRDTIDLKEKEIYKIKGTIYSYNKGSKIISFSVKNIKDVILLH